MSRKPQVKVQRADQSSSEPSLETILFQAIEGVMSQPDERLRNTLATVLSALGQVTSCLSATVSNKLSCMIIL